MLLYDEYDNIIHIIIYLLGLGLDLKDFKFIIYDIPCRPAIRNMTIISHISHILFWKRLFYTICSFALEALSEVW